MNVSPTKINIYKFVSTTGIAAASDAKKEEKATIGIQTKQVEAINQLGGVINGIAAVSYTHLTLPTNSGV